MPIYLSSWLFGFISGFLLLQTGNTLNFWLANDGFSTETISLFTLVSLPYALNFLWAPLLDNFDPKFIPIGDHPRTRLLFLLHFSGALMLGLISLAMPSKNLYHIAIYSFILSFLNTSQDIVLNAFRTEITAQEIQAKTSGIYIFGYRCGMILSGSVAIYFSQFISWESIFKIFSVITFTFPFIIVVIERSFKIQAKEESVVANSGFKKIFNDIGSPKFIVSILLFLALYRLADNFISVMLNPFLLDKGYSVSEIALVGKFSGIVGTAFGGIIATKIMNNKNLYECLFWFAIVHAFAHFSYVIIGNYDPNSYFLLAATILESVTAGLTMSAYIGLISSLCKGKYRATQYSIFSAMMGISRTILPTIAGFIVVETNWSIFFLFSIFLVVPSLVVLKIIEPNIKKKINV